ncbi:MAG: Helix-turn-helix domain [Bacteroidota bacterium]
MGLFLTSIFYAYQHFLYSFTVMKNDHTMFGQKVKRARLDAQLSQEGLAKSIGVHQSHISNIESGHSTPTIDELLEIAKVTKVPYEQLVTSSFSEIHNNTTHGNNIINTYGGTFSFSYTMQLPNDPDIIAEMLKLANKAKTQ